MKKMPTKRALHLTNHTADSVAFTLTFDNAPGGCMAWMGGNAGNAVVVVLWWPGWWLVAIVLLKVVGGRGMS